jgi:hypothetical protein
MNCSGIQPLHLREIRPQPGGGGYSGDNTYSGQSFT